MMMIYGMFVFMLRTLPYQQLQQSQAWRHVKNERVNTSAGWQYIGPGDNTITLNGVLYPEITGGNLSLAALTSMGYAGMPWPLISGVGQIYGMYVMTQLDEGNSEFDQYGNPKKIEFTITLSRVDSDIREKLRSASVGDVLRDLKSGADSAINAVSGAVSGLL